MISVLLALPLTAQFVVAPAWTPAGAALPPAFGQSQFTQPRRDADTMRFRGMDRNGDGVITRAEWRGSDQSFRAHDWNGDGILSGDEVRPGAQNPALDPTRSDQGIPEDREDTFENLDHNGNGQIEADEWHASEDAFRWLDRDRNGVLSRREVVGRPGDRTGSARARQNPRDPTTSLGSAGRENCDNSAARVVDDIYQQVLERPADQASAGFTQALESGRTTVKEIVSQLAKSQEHASRYLWQPVTQNVYQEMLNRAPSQQERDQMAAALASGEPFVDIVARTARRAASSDEEAVRILYRRLLGREADPEGLRGFTEQARTRGIESVGRDLVRSEEYRQRAGRSGLSIDEKVYESGVRALYRHLLGRDPDAAAIQTFTRIASSNGFNAAVDAIVDSAEYQRLYGTDVVPGRGTRYCGPNR